MFALEFSNVALILRRVLSLKPSLNILEQFLSRHCTKFWWSLIRNVATLTLLSRDIKIHKLAFSTFRMPSYQI